MNIACFGCSFTYGMELESPQKHAWPAVLASESGAQVKNLGICASSNRAISRNLMSYLVDNSPDAVVVMWTYVHRYEFMVDDSNVISVHCDSAVSLSGLPVPDYFEKVREPFFKYVGVTNSYAQLDTVTSINHAQLLLESKKIPYIFCTVLEFDPLKPAQSDVQAMCQEYFPTMLKFDGHDVETFSKKIGSWGVSHPLELAHDQIAKLIHKELIKKSTEFA